MCGIIGLCSLQPNQHDESRINSALRLMSHRGPDSDFQSAFKLAYGKCHLGHCRLSIIDLSDHGRQPMTSRNGRYVITYNGEIFNYKELRSELERLGVRFSTRTDTEVLLEAWSLWGRSCLNRLVGMYSFAVLDKARGVIECVRDPFGIKPFFYELTASKFIFASEISALKKISDEGTAPDIQRAFDYLCLGRYDDKDCTFVEGFSSLRPGCILTVEMGAKINSAVDRWWWPSIDENDSISFEDAVDKVRSDFLENVRLHMRSDVPTGAALSGGLDSSALVCAMRHIEPDAEIQTFSYIAGDGAANEEKWIDIVNEHTRAIPNKVRIEDEDLFRDLDDLIKSQGEPFGSTSIYAGYRVFRMVKNAGVVVCLEGQGADEIFAGYHGYPHAALRSLIESGRVTEAINLLSAWSKWPGRSRKDALVRLISDFVPDKIQPIGRRMVGRSVTKPWLRLNVLEDAGVSLVPQTRSPRTREGRKRRLAETLRAMISGAGLSHLLRHGDRNSMRWSVENRVPFLTAQCAEFALSLPERYLLSRTGETKSIFRAAMRGIVPDAIVDRRDKVGFETPELRWLGADAKEIGSILEIAREIRFLDVDELRKEVTGVLKGEVPFSWQAWRIINYCKWYNLVLNA